ncbi:MAG TPA: hypothetical protein VK652_04560 [Steroidobacteraceae bacterium]|nr:hypothetical protein [Steroidobacteraceae bacterium]
MAAGRFACRTILTPALAPLDLRSQRRAHTVPAMDSPDHDERLKDFFARHGGPGPRSMRRGQSAGGIQGWSEAYASDGYVLRCDWSTFGTLEEMKYSEIAPAT